MTIVLDRNPYKYEIEAVVKIFFPADRFNFVYNGSAPDGDLCLARLRVTRKYAYLTVIIRIGGKVLRKSRRLAAQTGDCENAFCRMLYSGLSRLTGKSSPWGMLTGIRPVKLVRERLAHNPDTHDLLRFFGEKYMVTSDEKLLLAAKIASVQETLLNGLPEKGFGLYVGIPFCPTRCTYCSFVSQPTAAVMSLIPQYTELLCRELEQTAELAAQFGMKPDTVYFGGGTPTALSAEQLDALLGCVRDCFDLSALREFCVEAGRPDTITPEKLATLKKHGVTRISINPQTLRQETLDLIGRKHTTAQFFESFRLAREMGFDNINTDLIAGLPQETADDLRRTLDGVLELRPEGITMHTLTIKRSADMFGNRSFNESTPEMIEHAHRTLQGAGYLPYYLYRQKNTSGNLENTGYALPGRESLYNIYIMEECQTILATGCAGSSKVVGNGSVKRVCNYKYPHEYVTDFNAILRRKDELRALLRAIAT